MPPEVTTAAQSGGKSFWFESEAFDVSGQILLEVMRVIFRFLEKSLLAEFILKNLQVDGDILLC